MVWDKYQDGFLVYLTPMTKNNKNLTMQSKTGSERNKLPFLAKFQSAFEFLIKIIGHFVMLYGTVNQINSESS